MMFSVVIQSGGQSRRMGNDKALLPFLGEPLIARVIRRVERIADEVLVTTNQPEAYSFLGVPLFPDLIPDRGALSGLYTALSSASQPFAAVIACDMPFINPDLLKAELERIIQTGADIVIPHTGSGLEPFHAVYRRDTCLTPIKTAIDQDKWRVDSWFREVTIEQFPLDEIVTYDPELLSFMNVNTPEELRDAVEIASRQNP